MVVWAPNFGPARWSDPFWGLPTARLAAASSSGRPRCWTGDRGWNSDLVFQLLLQDSCWAWIFFNVLQSKNSEPLTAPHPGFKTCYLQSCSYDSWVKTFPLVTLGNKRQTPTPSHGLMISMHLISVEACQTWGFVEPRDVCINTSSPYPPVNIYRLT